MVTTGMIPNRHLDHPYSIGTNSRVTTRNDGVIEEQWADPTGRVRRVLERHADGTRIADVYFFADGLSRIGGPASTVYDDGRVYDVEWYLDGLSHRVDGPAEIIYRPDGTAADWTWWVRGQIADTSWDAAELLSEIPSEELRVEFAHSDYAPFIHEGHSPEAIVAALRGGILTIEGIRVVLEGAPVEWALAFESGTRT